MNEFLVNRILSGFKHLFMPIISDINYRCEVVRPTATKKSDNILMQIIGIRRIIRY